jgi:hypothetical protein
VRHLRELLARNSAGSLNVAEQRELDQMVLLDDIVSLIRARVQGSLSPRTGSADPTGA